MLRDRDATFYKYDRKHGYYMPGQMPKANPLEDMSVKEVLSLGFRELKSEISKFVAEQKMPHQAELRPRPGETRVWLDFKESTDLKRFKHICDADWGEGYSSCSLSKSPAGGNLLFAGDLSSRSPQDGRNLRYVCYHLFAFICLNRSAANIIGFLYCSKYAITGVSRTNLSLPYFAVAMSVMILFRVVC